MKSNVLLLFTGKSSKVETGRVTDPSADDSCNSNMGTATPQGPPPPSSPAAPQPSSATAPAPKKQEVQQDEKAEQPKRKVSARKSPEMNGVAEPKPSDIKEKPAIRQPSAEKEVKPVEQQPSAPAPEVNNKENVKITATEQPKVEVVNDAPKQLVEEKPVSAPLEVTAETPAPAQEIEEEEAAATSVAEPVLLPPYDYKPTQWSPLNTTGEKAYGRDFMMAARNNVKHAPANLPTLEELEEQKRNAPRNTNHSASRDGGLSDFTPNFMRNQGPQRDRGGYSSQIHRGSNSMRGGKRAQKVIDAKPTAGVSLKTVDNAYVPMAKSNREVGTLESNMRELRAVLNKVSPENFWKLSCDFKVIIMANISNLDPFIDLIFEKAVTEQGFASPYALLCKSVGEKPEEERKKEEKDKQNSKNNNKSPEMLHFRKCLLVKCQQEFERRHMEENKRQAEIRKSLAEIEKCSDPTAKAQLQEKHDEKFIDRVAIKRELLSKEIMDAVDPAMKKKAMDELTQLDDKNRRKSVGLIKFVAELYRSTLLTNKTVLNLFRDLVRGMHKDEEAEIMCKLFINVGKNMWEETDNDGREMIKQCMSTIRRYIPQCSSSRIRCMLMDVMELYDNKFVAKYKSQKTEAPKSKKQVAETITHEANQQAAMSVPSNSGNRHSDGKFRGRYEQHNNKNIISENSDLWKTTIGSNSGSSKRAFKNIGGHNNSENDGDNPRLGPGGNSFSMWSRGASGGGASGISKDSQRNNNSNQIPMRSNRFGSLSQDDDISGPEMHSRHQMGHRSGLRPNPFPDSMPRHYNDSRDQMRGGQFIIYFLSSNCIFQISYYQGSNYCKSTSYDTLNFFYS